jgi:signal transduction histidine kinase
MIDLPGWPLKPNPPKVEQRLHARGGDERLDLEKFRGDLRSLLALPSTCSGGSCDFVLSALGDTLARMFDLRLVFTRVHSSAEGVHRDIVRLDRRYNGQDRTTELTAALEPWLSPDRGSYPTLKKHLPMGRENLSIASLRLGSRSSLGTLIVGAARDTFPTESERLLLRAAANEACVALLEDVRPNIQLRSLARLHRFSTALIDAGDVSAVLEQMLDAAMDLQGAEFGNVQLYDAELRGLVIVAQRNFQDPFLEHFALVRRERCACGRAADTHSRVIVEDVETDEGFAPHRNVAAAAGFRAVQSTPLIGNGGELLGMLSTHFRNPHRPSDYELRLTDIYAQQAARMLVRKRTDLALSRAQQELAHAGRVLSIGELTASLAHEINQPLAAIVTNANASRRWLERAVPNYKRARTALENIVRDGNRASAILQRVHTFAAKTVPARAPLNVNEVILEVVAIAANEIALEQVALRTQLAEHLPAVIADRVELQQVMLNLVINGIEALRTVAGRPKDLHIVSARRDKSTVEVLVRDNGNGIDAQHLEQMFDAFFTTKSRGMGLGLAISRRIIEAHDGTLCAIANQPLGLTLAFTLPVPRRRRAKRSSGYGFPQPLDRN